MYAFFDGLKVTLKSPFAILFSAFLIIFVYLLILVLTKIDINIDIISMITNPLTITHKYPLWPNIFLLIAYINTTISMASIIQAKTMLTMDRSSEGLDLLLFLIFCFFISYTFVPKSAYIFNPDIRKILYFVADIIDMNLDRVLISVAIRSPEFIKQF